MRRYALKVGYRGEKSRDRLETIVQPALSLAFEEIEAGDGLRYLVPAEKREAVEQFLYRMEVYHDCDFPHEWEELPEGGGHGA